MILKTVIAPPRSIVLVMDPAVGEIPASMAGAVIASTDSCVAIGTLSELDGDTSIQLAGEDEGMEIADCLHHVFSSVIKTRSEVAVLTVRLDVLLRRPVGAGGTLVNVWVNDLTEPDKIRIRISQSNRG